MKRPVQGFFVCLMGLLLFGSVFTDISNLKAADERERKIIEYCSNKNYRNRRYVRRCHRLWNKDRAANCRKFEGNKEFSFVYERSCLNMKEDVIPERKCFSVENVIRSDELNIRRGPSPQTEIIGEIPRNAYGILDLEESKSYQSINMKRPYIWKKIQYKEISGWVNSFYLSDPRPCP